VSRILTAAAAALLSFAAWAHHAPGPIHIAAVLTLTGPSALPGKHALEALRLGIERVNASGGVLSHTLELHLADDGGDPKRAAALAAELARPETADVLIAGSISATALAIVPVAQKAGIPAISLAGAHRVVDPVRRWVFKTAPSERMAVEALLTDMAKRGVKRLALLSVDDDFGRTVRQELRDRTASGSVGAKKYGIALALDEAFRSEPEAIAAAIERAKGVQADALLAVAFGDAAVLAVQKRSEARLAVPLYLSHGAATGAVVRRAGAAAEGVRFPAGALALGEALPDGDRQKKTVLEFSAAYRAKYGEEPSAFAGYAHDALGIFLHALDRVRSLDFGEMRQGLDSVRGYVGVTGVYSIWYGDHLGLAPGALRMVEVRGGKLVPLD
jgi:branched-chain amino acid transport system substrate-binding protein